MQPLSYSLHETKNVNIREMQHTFNHMTSINVRMQYPLSPICMNAISPNYMESKFLRGKGFF